MDSTTGLTVDLSGTSSGFEPPSACMVCSNGSALVYHFGGPCPHATAPNFCPHCGHKLR